MERRYNIARKQIRTNNEIKLKEVKLGLIKKNLTANIFFSSLFYLFYYYESVNLLKNKLSKKKNNNHIATDPDYKVKTEEPLI